MSGKTAKVVGAILASLAVCFFVGSLVLLADAMLRWPQPFFNADALYLPALFRDLFVDKYPLDGWALATAPVFFPEMPIFFLLAKAIGEVPAVLAWPGVLLTLWVVVALPLLHSLGPAHLRNWQLPLLCVCAGGFALLGTSGDIFFVELVSLVHPHGSLIVALLCVGLVERFHRKGGLLAPGILAVACAVAVASDLLFLPLFILPMLVVVLGHAGFRIARGKLAKIARPSAVAAVLVVSAWLGQRLPALLRGQNYFYYHSPDDSGELLWQTAGSALARIPFELFTAMTWPLGVALLMALVVCSLALVRVLRHPCAPEACGQRWLLAYFPIALVLVVAASAVRGQISYGSVLQPRYMSGVLTYPFLGAVLALLVLAQGFGTQKAPDRKAVVARTLLLLALLAFPVWLAGGRRAGGSLPRNELADCLDANRSLHQLQDGLGDYWVAKPATLFSRGGVRVHAVGAHLEIFHWVSNFWWYYGKAEKPAYNFVVMDRLHHPTVLRAFGPPDAKLSCGPGAVWVYHSNPKLAGYFGRPGLLLWKQSVGR